jgi:hypothetical protein
MEKSRSRFYENPQFSRADILPDTDKSMGYTRGVKTPVLPDEPGDATLVMWWKGLWVLGWRRVVECGGLIDDLLE